MIMCPNLTYMNHKVHNDHNDYIEVAHTKKKIQTKVLV